MKRLMLGIFAGACLLAGCSKEEPKAQPKQPGGVEINAPGVNIKAGQTGADVKVPGAGINVKVNGQ